MSTIDDKAYLAMARDFKEFSRDDVVGFIEQFKAFDLDKSGAINSTELGKICANLGMSVSADRIKQLIAEVDLDKSGEIEFNEFLLIMRSIKSGKQTAFGDVVQKHAQVNKIKGSSDSITHSFSEEEKYAFVSYINMALKGDQHIGDRLPINPDSNDIFPACKDGLLLCKLINNAVPDTIDERVLNTKKKMNAFEMTENNNLVVNSAKAIGCNVVNVGSNDLIECKIHLILGLMWQIIRIGLLSKVSLRNVPELFRLLEEGETLDDLLKLPPDQILLRWLNYHLKKAGSNKRVANYSSDIKDSEAYTVVMHQILPDQAGLGPMRESDMLKRAELMLQEADKIGCRKFVTPRDVVSGNSKLNLAFVANLFNTYPALEPLSQEEAAQLEEWLFNSQGTREARAFCLWMNSLGIEPFVTNLFEDLRDGLALLRTIDKVVPGIVVWSKVNEKLPLNKFKKVENCNYVILLGKDLKFSLVNIAGKDIVDGNQTLTLGFVWQLMRLHVISILESLSTGGKKIAEADMVRWANDTVASGGYSTSITGLNDSSLGTGVYFMHLLASLRKSAVNFDVVTEGSTPEDALKNAKYAISVARKLGACIFLLPEDIVEVKPKMILTFIGAIMAVSMGSSGSSAGESSSSSS